MARALNIVNTRHSPVSPSFALALLLICPVWLPHVHAREDPRHGGTLRLSSPVEFSSLDPAIAVNSDYQAFQVLIFHGLFDYDEEDHLVLDQAADWTLSSDKKTYRFTLKPGVRFGNGREVQAQDYVFALERVLDLHTES